jgi:hypothetical protein
VAHNGRPYELDAASPQGARLKWTGTLELTPLSSKGTFEISGARAHHLWTYVRDSVPYEITSGTIGFMGTYDLAAGGGPLALKVDVQNATMTQFAAPGRCADYVEFARLEEGTHVDVPHHTGRSGR